MRSVGSSTLAAVLVAAGLATSGCGPTYPACEKDPDCNKDKPRNEYCVNQVCQQCRKHADCPKGKECKKGRCEAIPDYCVDDGGCPPSMTCVENRCRPCESDGQCGEGGKCRQGRCVRKGMCDTDDDCPQDMDCKNGLCVGGKKPVAPPPTACKLTTVYFDFNEFVLTTDATDAIDRNAACVKQTGRSVQLIGKSDPRGTEEYNLALSEKRALQVKDRLIRLGVDGGKMTTLPKGELEATGKDESGWANDRRVDFQWN